MDPVPSPATMSLPETPLVYLGDLHGRLASVADGELASYIPELAHAHPSSFGITLVTHDGHLYGVGHNGSALHHPVFLQAVHVRDRP